MNGLPKRTDFQLAWEARQLQEHMMVTTDHSKCLMSMPCKRTHVRKVTESLRGR